MSSASPNIACSGVIQCGGGITSASLDTSSTNPVLTITLGQTVESLSPSPRRRQEVVADTGNTLKRQYQTENTDGLSQ